MNVTSSNTHDQASAGNSPLYLRNCWYQAAWAYELDAGPVARTLLDTPLVLFRGEAGVAALLDRCPHRFAPLSAGKFCGGRIECGYHGLVFDGSGRCVANPHGPITSLMRTPSFPAVERHAALWVWMGDPELADQGLIPDLSYIDQTPESARILIYTPTAANYQLMTDNIMDLSHADYLHPESLGGMMSSARSRVFKRGKGLVVEWVSAGCQAPGIFQAKVPSPAKADFWVEVEWQAPAVMTLSAGAVHAGQIRAPEDVTTGVQSMTPETAASTHYFACSMRRTQLDDTALTEMIRASLIQAFQGEDRPMLAAQQARIGNAEFWSLKPILLRVDAAAVQVRRRLDKLIADEQARLGSGAASSNGSSYTAEAR